MKLPHVNLDREDKLFSIVLCISLIVMYTIVYKGGIL